MTTKNLLAIKHSLVTDEAENGQMAVEKVMARASSDCGCPNYKLIIMDLNMPVMDGYQASLEISHLKYDGIIPKDGTMIIANSAF